MIRHACPVEATEESRNHVVDRGGTGVVITDQKDPIRRLNRGFQGSLMNRMVEAVLDFGFHGRNRGVGLRAQDLGEISVRHLKPVGLSVKRDGDLSHGALPASFT
jgi:hypothetical protein